jgi:hypothetical protein
MIRRRHGRDDWLGLTPEVERLGPVLVDRIAAALGEDPAAIGGNAVATLIRDGDAEAWMGHLGDLTRLVERARAAGRAEAEAAILAEILRDQYRLAPGVLDLAADDEARWARLEEITR